MVDNKRLKEVASTTTLTTGTLGSLPSTGVDGVPSPIRGSQEGVLYVSLTNPTGTVGAVATDTKATGSPGGVNIFGIFETTPPTYVNGDPVIAHYDDRGRLLVSLGEGIVTADVDTDQDPGPTTPRGQYIIGKYEATLPTYTDGDNSVLHHDERGRQIVRNSPGTASALTNVAGSAASTTLLAANTARIGAVIYNDSTADLYVKLGATASTTSFTVKLTQNGTYEVPSFYVGVIDGIWAAATGNARVTEIS